MNVAAVELVGDLPVIDSVFSGTLVSSKYTFTRPTPYAIP